jgi:hypothetical protein
MNKKGNADMKQAVSDVLGVDEAEEAIAEIWMYVERHRLPPPLIQLKFNEDRKRLRIYLDIRETGVGPAFTFLYRRSSSTLLA